MPPVVEFRMRIIELSRRSGGSSGAFQDDEADQQVVVLLADWLIPGDFCRSGNFPADDWINVWFRKAVL